MAAVRFALQLLHAWSRECVFFSHQETARDIGTVWNIHLDHLRSHGLVLQKRWRVQGLHEPMPQPDRFLSGFRAVCFCTLLAPHWAPHLLYVCVILGDVCSGVRFSGHCHGSKKTKAGWMMFEYVGWSKCLGSFQSLRGGWGFENLQPNGPWYCKVPFFLSSFLSLSVRLYISSNQCAGLVFKDIYLDLLFTILQCFYSCSLEFFLINSFCPGSPLSKHFLDRWRSPRPTVRWFWPLFMAKVAQTIISLDSHFELGGSISAWMHWCL